MCGPGRGACHRQSREESDDRNSKYHSVQPKASPSSFVAGRRKLKPMVSYPTILLTTSAMQSLTPRFTAFCMKCPACRREFGASGSPRLGKTPIRKGKPRRRGEHRGFGFPFCGGKPVVGREAHHDNIVTSATLTDNCSVSSCRPSPATVGHLCSHQISREDVDGGKFGGKPGNGCRAFLFSQGATKFSPRLNQPQLGGVRSGRGLRL